MNRAEVEKDYKVENGIITSPGKFEGEPIFVLHFWDCVLDGMGYAVTDSSAALIDECSGDDMEDDDIASRVDIEPEDIAEYPELFGYKAITLWETQSGFVQHMLHKQEILY